MGRAKPLSVSELRELLPRINATVALLTGSANGAPRTNGANGAVRSMRKSPGGAKKLRARIVEHLKTSRKGMASAEIAAALNEDAAAVRYGLDVLRAEKKVRMTGDRRTALYQLA